MKTKLKATFADGQVLTRTTTNPKLAFAWRFRALRSEEAAKNWNGKREVQVNGFSSSRLLASKAAGQYLSGEGWTNPTSEIVEVEVVGTVGRS